MKQTKFDPFSVEINGDIISLHFNKGDITTYIHKEMYTLKNSSIRMDLRICNQKVLNKDNFIFESDTGKEATYHAMQVKPLPGIMQILNEVIKEATGNDSYIKISKETETLIKEIMNYHKNELVNKYLEENNYNALKSIL